MKTAKFVKNMPGWNSDARLFELSHPFIDGKKKYSHVIVSAVDLADAFPIFKELEEEYLFKETYIFPSTPGGKIISWIELRGSYKGGLSHETALSNAGYSMT